MNDSLDELAAAAATAAASSPQSPSLLPPPPLQIETTPPQAGDPMMMLNYNSSPNFNANLNAAPDLAAQRNYSLDPTGRFLYSPTGQLLIKLNNSSLVNYSEELEIREVLEFPPQREDLSTAIPLTVIFALLLATGCIGNLCTAIVIARPKNKYMHTATNYYLFSLAVSDFLFLILGLPQEMYALWQRYPYAFGEAFCIIRGFLSEASTYASILTITAFTVERYVAICYPLWAHTMSQLPRAITSILIIWLLAAVCAIPPAAELGITYSVSSSQVAFCWPQQRRAEP